MSKTIKSMMTLGFAAVAGAVGCATPCVDDGLNQSFCPPTPGAGTAGESSDAGTAGPGMGEGGHSGSSGEGAANGTPYICPVLDVALTPETPTVALLVDQSGSMIQAFGDDGTRWDAVGRSLFDPMTGLVAMFESKMRFGLTLYTSQNGNEGGECPILQERFAAVNNFDEMRALYDNSGPAGDTPTGDSLEVLTQQLVSDPDTAPKYIILATDGEPDTCAQPNPQYGQEESVAAAQAAYEAGIQTFVISVGNDVSDEHLQDLANAGAGVMSGDPDATFYKALNEQGLIEAFEDIAAEVQDCRLTLSESLDAELARGCAVALGKTIVPEGDDSNGWRLISPEKIQLLGAACDAVQEQATEVKMLCDCAVVR